MKAAIYYGPRDIRVEQLDRPTVGPNDVLIRVAACGICGSDLHTYRFGIFPDLGKVVHGGEGRVMGHEFSGDVVEVGSAVTSLKVGQRIATVSPGAYAEYAVVDASDRAVLPIPDHVSYEEAATVEPLAVSIHAVNLTAPVDGETIVVIGAGIIGLGCIQVIKARTSARVIAVDGSAPRLAMAKDCGADELVDFTRGNPLDQVIALTGGERPVPRLGFRGGWADAVIDAAGAPPTTQQGLDMLKEADGRLILVALSEHEGPIDRNVLVRKQIRFQGSWSSNHQDMRDALDLIASGKINRKPLVSHQFSLDEAAEAFKVQEAGQAIKVVVKP
ncbi:MAG: zinc-binding dehydrogenase [Chloroflexota bacterium]